MVLEQAQAAGQKAQQDALIGQGSIFDLAMDDAAGVGGGGTGGMSSGAAGGAIGPTGGFAAPSHAPVPGEEFDRTELLAAEKESLGLFISAHPLKEVGAALRARCDSTLTEVASRRDGDWVTIGGIITQARPIKTKKGDWMMFATLYDLEESVEIVVFGNVLATARDALASDTIVLVRGKVDHKDRETTCLIAQQVERFEPSEQEVLEAQEAAKAPPPAPDPLRLRLDATALPATALGELKELLAGFPGESDVVVELRTSVGRRRLKLGPSFRVARTAGLHAELDALLGSALITEAAGPRVEVEAAGVA
ncbi:MAG: OB-fold nucleic acid binding domain-containing protein, partial [Solirubrobacteraceae bacterium]